MKARCRILVLGIVSCVSLLLQASVLSFSLGVENIPDDFFKKLSAQYGHPVRVGLVTNQTGKTQHGVRTVDVLREHGAEVKCIFSPEHGYDGMGPAAKAIDDSVDQATGIKIISLHGKRFWAKTPEKIVEHGSAMHDLDVIVFDIQDCGMRHYTYISTLLDVMRAAAHKKKKLVILDRPNPLGTHMEGPLVEDRFISFISIAKIPVRHGMTVGELARYFNNHVLADKVQLQVVPMRNYDRMRGFSGAYLAHLSSGLNEPEACYGYSYAGLLGEVRPFNNKREKDKTKKYQCISVRRTELKDPKVLAAVSQLLHKHAIPHKPYQDDKYEGFELQLKDANFSAFSLLVDVLKTFHNHKIDVQFSKEFDWAVGTDKVRQYILGSVDRKELITHVNDGLKKFHAQAKPLFLYHPHPTPKYLK